MSGQPPFDLDRLTSDERGLWEQMLPDGFTVKSSEGPDLKLWSFSYACMLELHGAPQVVSEATDLQRTGELVSEHMQNVRPARRRR